MFNIDQTFQGTERILVTSPPSHHLAMLASEDKSWFEVYKAALLELDPQKLPERISAAKEKVRLRLEEIRGDSDHHAERQQIEDALNSLRVLEREK